MDEKTKSLLSAASLEIKNLRLQNEKLTIRVTAIDDMLQLLNSQPPRVGQGYSEDVAFKIDRHLTEQAK